MSETSKCRSRLKKWCVGIGLDCGSGGDPIVPTAISLDLIEPYDKSVGNKPIHLIGDCRDLYWFKDSVLNYIFSSHLLEDFTKEEQIDILKEWVRVIKPKGLIILYLPDEAIYQAHCEENHQPANTYHKNSQFSLDWIVANLLDEIPINIIHSDPFVDDYSFEIILEKQEG